MSKNVVVNEAMVSENNSKKFLRILKEDVSKFCFFLGGTVAACFLPGVWGMAIPAIPFFMATYYGLKALARAERVKSEDNALMNMEKKSSVAAQKEVKRQNVLLNDLENASQNSGKVQVPQKEGLLRRLKKGVKSSLSSNKQRSIT